jgi:hypothetical protein
MNVKTTHVEQLWQTPDGTRKIWEVNLKGDDGREYRLKTYSPKISQLGFKGEVKSYVNFRGERFVRQVLSAPKPSFTRDDSAIRAQWAIGQAINLASVKMDKDAITLPVIETYAKELFATVSRVKGEEMSPQMEREADQYIKGLVQVPSAI